MRLSPMPYRDWENERACQRRHYRSPTEERLALGLCRKRGKAAPEPDRRFCARCQTMRRAAELARWARANALGQPYCGTTEPRCKAARAKTKRRFDRRLAAGLCPGA